MRPFFLLLVLASCSQRESSYSQELPPTKQKQKIAFLQKKLQLAEREGKRVQTQIERLDEEVREAQIALIRKQVDDFEEMIRKNPKKKRELDAAEMFVEEQETLRRMIQNGASLFEAQLMLERILQLIANVS